MHPGVSLIIFLAASFVFSVWDFFLLRISYLASITLSLIISAVALGCIVMLSMQREGTFDVDSALRVLYERIHNGPSGGVMIDVLIAANLGLALLVKLYRAIVLEQLTAAERSPASAGFRAWLSPMNVISVVCLAITCMIGFGSGLGVMFVGLCVLLAIPTVNTLLQTQPAIAAPPAQAPADERQRVLALVEAGKITAEDAAELLNALAQSQAAEVDAPLPMTGPRRVVMVGAALVLIGFFLPWFSIDVVRATNETISDIQQLMPQYPVNAAPNVQSSVQFTLRGGDVRNGLGWIALTAAMAIAGLPIFIQQRSVARSQQSKITFVALAIGSIATLYLLSNSFNAITTIQAGFYLVVVGYALLWTGTLREGPARERRLSVAVAAAV